MIPSNPAADDDGNGTGVTPDAPSEELARTTEERRQRRISRWHAQQPESDIDFLNLSELQGRFDEVQPLLADGGLLVVVHNSCREKVAVHLAERDIELGGLLIGRVFGDGPEEEAGPLVKAVEISKAIQSQDYEATHISLAMDSSIWTLAHASLDEGETIVGWYHSHPGLGAFFSSTDQQTQRAIFPHAYSVALVSDPVRGQEKWFVSGDALEVDPSRIVYV